MLITKLKSAVTVIFYVGTFGFLLLFSACNKHDETRAPLAKKIAHTERLNDDIRLDYYYWLREKDNPEVKKYIEAENQYTNKLMETSESLQNKLVDEFCKRNFNEDYEVPQQKGEYYYYTKMIQGMHYPVYCRKKKLSGSKEEVILDPNKIADKDKYFKIATFEMSDDQKYMAYCVDSLGYETNSIYIKDVESGKLLKDCIINASSNFIWASDNRTIFYTKMDKDYRANRVYKHRLGEASSRDEFVYYEKDDSYQILLYKSSSNRYIFIGAGNISTTETYYIDAYHPDMKPKLVYPRQENLEYYVYDSGPNFYILTNDRAKNFKVVVAPISNPSKKLWKDVISYRQEIKIDELKVFKNFLALFEREKGEEKIEIVDLRSRSRHYVKFDEAAYTIGYDVNSNYYGDILSFRYSSFINVPSLLNYNMGTREKKVIGGISGVRNYSADNYKTEKVLVGTSDGKKVPVILVYKKGIVKDGSNPMVLTGYGAYNKANEAKFSSEIVSLLDRGCIYGIAHIRGGGEIDGGWYEEGKLLKKKNSFSDFIACAEYFIKEKYTSRKRLAIWGRSAGGLVIGTVVNMRPDLFKAAVAENPFVDVLNTMLDPSLKGTVQEYEEWGDPNNKIFYDYIKSYSPYDNVKEQTYPDMLILGALKDTRVSYWEPLKWTAKLREKKRGNSMLMLKIYEDGDHTGGAQQLENYRRTAFKYAFMLNRLGIEK